MACYAPLLVNVNPGGRQWAVNLIGYDALKSFGSPSYHAQRMFAQYVGDRTVPLAIEGGLTQTHGEHTLPALFASATRDRRRGAVYLKVVNALPSPQVLNVTVNGGTVRSRGTLIELSGDPHAMNSLEEPTRVAPTTRDVDGLGPSFHLTLKAHSVNIVLLST